MRTAEQWQEELAGETSVESIRAIQEDALSHAAVLLTANAHSPTKGFEAVHRELVKLQNRVPTTAEEHNVFPHGRFA